jgi:ribonuclease E
VQGQTNESTVDESELDDEDRNEDAGPGETNAPKVAAPKPAAVAVAEPAVAKTIAATTAAFAAASVIEAEVTTFPAQDALAPVEKTESAEPVASPHWATRPEVSVSAPAATAFNLPTLPPIPEASPEAENTNTVETHVVAAPVTTVSSVAEEQSAPHAWADGHTTAAEVPATVIESTPVDEEHAAPAANDSTIDFRAQSSFEQQTTTVHIEAAPMPIAAAPADVTVEAAREPTSEAPTLQEPKLDQPQVEEPKVSAAPPAQGDLLASAPLHPVTEPAHPESALPASTVREDDDSSDKNASHGQ